MVLLLRLVVRVLALAGLLLYAFEAAAVIINIAFICLFGCSRPSDWAPVPADLALHVAEVPRIVLPAGIVLAVSWVACLALLLRAGRWVWALVVGLAVPVSLSLYLGAIYGVPDGLPQTYAAWIDYRTRHSWAYLVSLLGPLTLVVATYFTRPRRPSASTRPAPVDAGPE